MQQVVDHATAVPPHIGGAAPADTGAALRTPLAMAVVRQRSGVLAPYRPGRSSRKLLGMDLNALETSFDLVAPRGDELIELFYSRLFETAPAVQPLFAHADMARQRQMLLAALVLLRRSLRNLDAVVPTLRQLGARHIEYGAEEAHYAVVGSTLIGAMAEIGGADWRDAYTEAWTEAFTVVATTMLEGAAEAQLAIAA
jgi:hemoglobin-like flavoprotein